MLICIFLYICHNSACILLGVRANKPSGLNKNVLSYCGTLFFFNFFNLFILIRSSKPLIWLQASYLDFVFIVGSRVLKTSSIAVELFVSPSIPLVIPLYILGLFCQMHMCLQHLYLINVLTLLSIYHLPIYCPFCPFLITEVEASFV